MVTVCPANCRAVCKRISPNRQAKKAVPILPLFQCEKVCNHVIIVIMALQAKWLISRPNRLFFRNQSNQASIVGFIPQNPKANWRRRDQQFTSRLLPNMPLCLLSTASKAGGRDANLSRGFRGDCSPVYLSCFTPQNAQCGALQGFCVACPRRHRFRHQVT